MHSSFPKGTTIKIFYRDGTTTVGKFFDHKSGKVLLEDGRAIVLKKVRAITQRDLNIDANNMLDTVG